MGAEMKPTDTLKNEHKVILMVIDVAEKVAGKIADSKPADMEAIGKIVDFLKNFADRCHHAKEENLLFVKMEERGIMKEGGPIAVMLREHEIGRSHVRSIADSLKKAKKGDTKAIHSIMEHLVAFAEVLRPHIMKEDRILYPMADHVMNEVDQEEMAEAFEAVEKEMGEGFHERYHNLAIELSGK